MDDFYAARSRTIPPLPWSIFAPPISQLQELNLVEEITGRKRGRVFAYRAYLDVLSDGVAR